MRNHCMSEVETGNHIGGRWSTTVDTVPVINPANGETIATVPRSTRETAGEAVAAAKAAANAWARDCSRSSAA